MRHEATLEAVDDDRTIAICHCGWRALFTVEHEDGDTLVPFSVEVFARGEPGARHPVMLGSSSGTSGSCPL